MVPLCTYVRMPVVSYYMLLLYNDYKFSSLNMQIYFLYGFFKFCI